MCWWKRHPAECAALASRMKLPEITALTCRFCLERDRAESLLAGGHLLPMWCETCVVSLEDFGSLIEERFTVRFVEASHETDNDRSQSRLTKSRLSKASLIWAKPQLSNWLWRSIHTPARQGLRCRTSRMSKWRIRLAGWMDCSRRH